MVSSCHDLWGCGAHPQMRGCGYPRLLVRIHAEQGSNLGALLYAFQLEQNGVVGFATVADVAGVYDHVHHVVVDLILEHDAGVVVVLADVVDAVAAAGDVVVAAVAALVAAVAVVVDVVVVGGWLVVVVVAAVAVVVEPVENVKVDGNDGGDEKLALGCQ